ncbi:hypothetical protein Glo7428_0394 [Gloeocapsa sp. PCC 7428]|uniref:DUF6888 family protein n=1 Tax=Gloeocapsa sp. PCC 7428 TaxID=1173026 RepID=UPI0002A5D1D0|nr:hypothetical protein [Gloeocapsa sp. PCC 7428]AFZ28995.1 hypothetical protein Glo7428_0394 [Gloeocapsa sp. PCC 7428]
MITNEQALKAVYLCQLLSDMFQPINIFRYDQKLKTLYIQAGVNDELAIVIFENGQWEFV